MASPPIVFTPPPDVSHDAPVLRPSIPMWAPPPAPPVAPAAALLANRSFRVVVVLGVSLVVAAGVLTAGWLYGRKLDRQETDAQVAITRRTRLPPPVDPRVPHDAGTVTAAPAVADALELAPDALALPVASADAATAAVDAALATPDAEAADVATVSTADDVAVAAVDAAEPAQPSEPAHSPAGRRRRHPHSFEMDDLEERITPEIQACITDQRRRRHVHVAVAYEAATGHPIDVRVSAPYGEPPVGPCIENVIRAHPVEPFSDSEFQTHFSFDSH
jgi:hypothetical protein